MRETSIYWLWIGLLSLQAYAQPAHQVGRFSYQMKAKTVSANCDLMSNGLESVFIMYDKELQNATDTTHVVGKDGSNRTTYTINVSDGKNFALYQDFRAGIMISRELLFNGRKCIVQDSVPWLNWQLSTDKRQIGNYSCQKATTTFRCSTYTVWFTSAIPLSVGPWKLSGLPGLIVEATNENLGVVYSLTEAEYPVEASSTLIVAPDTGEPVYKYKEFVVMQQKELKKMQTYLKSMAGNPSDGQFVVQTPECFSVK